MNTAAGTARSTPPSLEVRSTRTGCDGLGFGASGTIGGRPAGPGRRRHLLAAARCPHLAGADPAPHLWPGKDQHIPVPGWPYWIVCALEPGRSSWTAPLDALRLAPGVETATVIARQLRDLVERLIATGQGQTGHPDILIIADAGYDAPRLALLLRNPPVQVLARMRSDRVLRRPAPPREPHTRGRPPRHGGEFVFRHSDTWGTPDTETVTDTRLNGTALARSWDRLHPKLTHRSSWATADGTPPIVEGTVIRLDIECLPSEATPRPVWLWWSETDADAADTDRLWQAYLRRFDIEHTFRLFKQTLGWTCPKVRTPKRPTAGPG